MIANGLGGSLGHYAPNPAEEECAHKLEENPWKRNMMGNVPGALQKKNLVTPITVPVR